MVSVIISSLYGDTSKIEKELKKQSLKNYEVILIKNTSPVSKARNIGAKKARGDILIFLDDDIVFGSKDVLEKIVNFLKKKENVGACGTGVLLPQGASWFEKRLAREIKRIEIFPPEKFFQTADGITGICFGIKKETFFQIKGFDERLISGEDPEFFYRLSKNGFRNFIAPVFVYHHAPDNLFSLLKKFFWYGEGYYQSRHLHPEWKIGPKIESKFKAILYILLRTLFLPIHIFIDSDFRTKKISFGFKPLRAVSSYASAWGYIISFLKI